MRTVSTDKLIDEVNGSMAIEGMPLTEEDKSRIRHCIEHPEQIREVLQKLIAKHKGIAVATDA